jgi:hypothetical protein
VNHPSDTISEIKERLEMHDSILRGGPGGPGIIADLQEISRSNERVVGRLDEMDRRERDARKERETERRSRNTQVGLLSLGVLGSAILAWFSSLVK